MSDRDELSMELAQIERDLCDRAIDKQKSGLDRLARVPADLAVPLLGRVLESSDFMQRRIAVMGLSNFRSDSSFELLARAIATDSDANIVGEAANSIFDFGDRAIPILLDLFKTSDNWLIRQTILSLLIDSNYQQELLTTAEMAIGDQTQSVKETGILALGHLLNSPEQARALELLLALCDDPNWRNRWRATISLQSLSNPTTQTKIAQLQQGEHFRVVAAALEVANYWASHSQS